VNDCTQDIGAQLFVGGLYFLTFSTVVFFFYFPIAFEKCGPGILKKLKSLVSKQKEPHNQAVEPEVGGDSEEDAEAKVVAEERGRK
jgi:hypothetical protein